MIALLYFVFVLSGAAGLMYESIWTRYLGLFVGHSAYAQVIVLVIFLGGMSIGALLVGRRSETLARPLLWYAAVELATGVIGLVFHDVFVSVTAFAYDTVFPSIGVGVGQTIAKWTIASVLILPQSILLGTTFPLMSAGVVRRTPGHAGRSLSMLYFANSLGAAAGVLVAGFYLVNVAGLPGTLIAAAMVNIAVAGIVFVALRRAARHESAAATPDSALATPDPARGTLWRLLLAVSFGTALSSFIYEIGWIRMLALVLGGATHSFELMLSSFILGLAVGAVWVRRRADAGSLAFLGVVQIAMGTLAIATLPVYMTSFGWMAHLMAAFAKTQEGYTMFTASRYVLCLAVMLPTTFCAGMTLPIITRMLVGAGVGERAIGQVYGVNTLGSIVGAALAGLVLLPLLGLKWLLIAGASVDLGLGVVLLVVHARQRGITVRSMGPSQRITAAAVAAVIALIVARVRLDHTVLTSGVFRYGHVNAPGSRNVMYFRDGRTATVSVRRNPGTAGITLATNGKPDASLGVEWLTNAPAVRGPFTHDAPTQLFIPLVALAHVPAARQAAVIGYGSGMTTHALLGSPALEQVVTIEIERSMIEGSRFFFPANRRALEDPRSRIVIDDARSYFASRRQRFDLIVSEPSNPWVSGVSGLFTTEFYSRIRGYLTPNGVFAQWLHLYEIDDALVLGVVSALSEHFPTYSMFQIGPRDLLIVASAGGRLQAPDWSVMQIPAVAHDLRRVWPITPSTLETLRIADQRSLSPLVRLAAAPNSDFYPALDLNAERSRYMGNEAAGFINLSAGRPNIPALVDGRRNGLGDPYAVVSLVPRLTAMAANVASRTGDPRGGPDAGAIALSRRQFEEEMRIGRAPIDWRVWMRTFATLEAAVHGGMAGVADSSFYATARAYMVRASAPPEARAAVDFLHGMAAWDLGEAARAAGPLVDAAARGDNWLDGDELRDGAVLARLATGDRKGADDAFKNLLRNSARPVTDLRTRLLAAYLADTMPAPALAKR
jgi:predicted membrane-bound spermidine synthase